jgi:hypothetical protein
MRFPLEREASRNTEVPMRRFGLLAALLLPLLVPGSALAGGCPPGVPEGVVDKDVYRLGEIVDFFDSYHDFADPGTVTIAFERPSDGATREFTAYNGPDGTWYRQVTFDSAADVGDWNVTVVVDQTDALDTCTDGFTIRARSGMPNTSTTQSETGNAGPGDGAFVILFAIGGFIVTWPAIRRRTSARRSG